jgi:hypothetical protein
MISQSAISGTLLLAIRQTEAQRGQLLVHHGRADHALRPTQRRRHKLTDRRARKLAARYREHVNVEAQRLWGLKLSEAERLNDGSLGGFEFV